MSLQVAPYKTHRVEAPSRTVTTTVGELAKMYHMMFKMRRMEVASDMQYKAKLIRGFCHLWVVIDAGRECCPCNRLTSHHFRQA
jgi:pyruvate dehydrogenase E1 component alpha subunit